MAGYVDDTLKRIQGHDGVLGTILMTSDGAMIKTTLDQKSGTEYSCMIADVCDKMRKAIKDINSSNDLTSLRIGTKKNEMIVIPDKEYIMVTIRESTE